MDEHVLAAVVAGHEAKALGVVEPFDLAADADRGRRIGRGPARTRARRRRAAVAERALRPFDDAGGVDFDHPRHLRALGAGADDDLQLGARGHRFVARGMQRVGVQEGVALAVGQFDEAIALVGLEPFDDRVDRRPVAAGGEQPPPPIAARRRSRASGPPPKRARRAVAARRASARRRRNRACEAPESPYPCSCDPNSPPDKLAQFLASERPRSPPTRETSASDAKSA